jgi:WXG100 family type VII secretion target
MAATGTIRTNVEGLVSAAQQLRGQKEEFESVVTAMERIVNSLGDSWEGAAHHAYGEQFASLKPGLNEVRELINTIATQLDQIAQLTQERDEEIAGKLNQR